MMAEEPAMDFEGGAPEDNLSMPLGDFMAFLDSNPAPDEDVDPEVRRSYTPARFSALIRVPARAR